MYEFDVSYSSKFPRFDISKIDKNIEDVLAVFVGNKSKSWQHEAEHRLIFEQGSRSLKIDYRAIKGFVFGCRMPQDDIDYVMKTFSGRGLAYYQIARVQQQMQQAAVMEFGCRLPRTRLGHPQTSLDSARYSLGFEGGTTTDG